MSSHTIVVEFDGSGPSYGAGTRVLGGRVVAVDFSGDLIAECERLREQNAQLCGFDDYAEQQRYNNAEGPQ